MPPNNCLQSTRIPLRAYHPSFHQFILRLRCHTITRVPNGDPKSPFPSLPPRSRPFYFMPFGPRIILSIPELTELSKEDTQHPRIRRHIAACKAIEYFHLEFQPRPENNLSYSKPPIQLKILCQHYNTNYLVRVNDLHLQPLELWRFVYRRSFDLQSFPTPAPSHQAIYIQSRHSTKDELILATQKRRKPTCHRQIGLDYKILYNNTTIAQPEGVSLMYLAKDLHCRPHGSVGMDELNDRKCILDILQIPNSEIFPTSTNTRGFKNTNNIHVIYSHHLHIIQLDRSLIGGLSRLHFDLTKQRLTGHKTDKSRQHGKVINDLNSTNIRLRFGFGRVQRKAVDTENWKVIQWNMYGVPMPTIEHLAFTTLPDSLKIQLTKLFESAQMFVDKCIPNAFPKGARTHHCTKTLNNALGIPHTKSKFEYYDIVLSRNTVLPKHIDSKNDHRSGYNLCTVYSYYQAIDGLEYKVSVIMTTRSSVGAAFDKAQKLKHK